MYLKMFKEDMNMRNISEQDEIEKELSKWKRRWTLEEMRERTMDSMDPCPEHFQKLHTKLEEIIDIVDPEYKDYINGREKKKDNPKKATEKEALLQTIKFGPSSHETSQMSVEKLFKGQNAFGRRSSIVNSRALVSRDSSFLPNMETLEEDFLTIKESGKISSLNELLNKMLAAKSDTTDENKLRLFEKLWHANFTTQIPNVQLPPSLAKTVAEAEDMLKDGDEIVAQFAIDSAKRKADILELQEKLKSKGINLNFSHI
ncbi:uncharacterized protein [Rhodnius prolixus]|uniref:Uncharacterized protein n=1 Tax=Rhodnius prolixus TaxID=13249 RepID=T1I5K6_RHOPR